jgi:hypothetical protein
MRNQPSTNIWSYWEGPSFPLLDLCRETMLRHNPSAVLLNPETFDPLWKYDRDLDFSKRCLAHKADFIRFYLLKEYGGLWVDADCIVMKPLQPVLDCLPVSHFIANHEGWGKNFGCNFIAAPQQGWHICDIYQRVVRRLRDPRPLSWLELTDGSVKDVVMRDHESKGFLRLDTNMVEPISWNGSWDAFFTEREDHEHAIRFNPDSLTYMLSNNSMGDRAKQLTRDQLLKGRFFISYVLRRALGLA